MKKRIAIVVAIVVASAIGVGVWLRLRESSDHGRGIFVSGNIEAIEVDLSFRLAGQIKTRPVDEGDRVRQDQVVATLDTDSLVAQKGVAESEAKAQAAILDELEEGSRKEQVEAARAVLKAAESRLKNARDEYERYQMLVNQRAISQSTFDTKETAFKVALEEHSNAAQRLQELESGPRSQEIRAGRARLEKAKWDVKRLELDIEHSTLTTPVSGVVLVKANEVGEVVLPGATVVTVAAIDEVWLKGYVGERDLGRVKLGQKVDVFTDTYPNKTYRGTVTYISSRAEFTPKNVQTREERVKLVYRVKVTIKNPDQELKIGMPAEGYILVNGADGSKRSHLSGAGNLF